MDHVQGDDHATARLVSRLLGWSYFGLWSGSFYLQPLHHIRRRSTHGFSIDFSIANVVGLTCYAVSNALLLYSPSVRHEYARRFPEAPEPAAAFNDFAYATHGAAVMVVVLTQFVPCIWGFDRGGKVARPSPAILAICGTFLLGVCLSVASVGSIPPWSLRPQPWTWLDVADSLATVKVVLTVIKYIPQAWTNYRLSSTAGFNMVAVSMDLVGALFSLLQLGLDAAVIGGGDWSAVTRNPGKFGLGNVSLLFAAIFLWQHHVLYRASWAKDGSRDVEDPNDRRVAGTGSDDDDDDDDDEVVVVVVHRADLAKGRLLEDDATMTTMTKAAVANEQTPLLPSKRSST